MYSAVHEHVVKKISEAVIVQHPYPHTVVDNLFPDNLYDLLLTNKLSDDILITLKNMRKTVGTSYSDNRNVIELKPNIPQLTGELEDFWQNFSKYMHYHFYQLIMKKFKLPIVNTKVDFLYTRDTKNYSLGPHTDKKSKLLTCLIYMPTDNRYSNLGTSIYEPKDKNFRCGGGPHYKFEYFNLLKTIEYIPNRMFCFLKTDNSFHGVEPINIEVKRNLLIFDIQRNEV